MRYGGFEQSLSIKKDLIKNFFYAAKSVSRLPHADILITNDFWLPVFAGLFRSDTGKIVVNANRFPKGQYRLYGRASRIAAASNAVRDAIVQQCPALKTRTLVFPNPIDTNVLYPLVKGRNGIEPRTLLFVGRLHPEKGVHVLVNAFSSVAGKFPNWRLRLVGPTVGQSLLALLHLARDQANRLHPQSSRASQ